MNKRKIKQPKVKLRWKIILPLIGVIIITLALMVKEFKDQRQINEYGIHITTINHE